VVTNGAQGDFSPAGSASPGNAALSIQALLDGDLRSAAAVQPLLGPFSILLRVPFAGVADLLGGDEVVKYQAGAFACLLGPVALGIHLGDRMAGKGAGLIARLVLALLCVVNPMTLESLAIGHPEEPLAAALVAGAVLVAADRPRWAGGLLGLALATKQWALVAAPVVVVAARRGRVALVLIAAVVGAALLVPVTLADRAAADAVRDAVLDSHLVSLLSAWWPISEDAPGGGSARLLPLGATRAAIAPALFVLSAGLAVALWRRVPRVDAERALALLALVLMLRCALDPATLQYYTVGPMLAVCAWEAMARPGLPLIALLYAATSWVAYGLLLDNQGDTMISVVYLTLVALFAALMARAAFAPVGSRA